jgi:hypothetical protein
VKLGSFIHDPAYFARYVGMAAAKASHARGDVDYVVALAHREFESWFVAAVASLAGCCGVPASVDSPDHFDRIRDAKGWLSRRMAVAYDPITHQHQFAKLFDLGQAQKSPSFGRLYCKIVHLAHPKGGENDGK